MNLNGQTKRERKRRAMEARRILFLLLGHHMKEAEIAIRLSVTTRTVKRWLYERRVPGEETVEALKKIAADMGAKKSEEES